MPKTLIEEIDDFRWGNRMPSRPQAIRELIRGGLEVEHRRQRGGGLTGGNRSRFRET
jgi:metal-responsive CopG/Arc/MetJ family transcriptional regulator